MKKKLLGLLLVLCLIVALIPLTATAANPKITVAMPGLTWTDIEEGAHKYATTDATTGTATECLETDNWNIHLDYTTGQTPTVYLKNATLTSADAAVAALKVTTSGAVVLNSVAGTTNTLSTTVAGYQANAIHSMATQGITITGTGKLNAHSNATGHAGSAICSPYNILFDNADVDVYCTASYLPAIAVASSTGGTAGHIPGEVTIKGGNLKITNPGTGRAIAYLANSYGQSHNHSDLVKNVYIKDGANVQIFGSGTANVIGAAGDVRITNANLEITKTGFPGHGEMIKFPQFSGTHLVEYDVNGETTTRSFLTTDTADADYIAPGTDMKAGAYESTNIKHIKITHAHQYGGNCTVGGTCSECNATVAAQANHSFANFEALTCSNSGCTYTRPAGLYATIGGLNMDTAYGETKYATMSAAGVAAAAIATDAWNIKIDYTGNVPVLSLQNITEAGGTFNLSGMSALQIDVLTDVTVTANSAFTLAMEGGATISSPTNGLLTVKMASTSGQKIVTVPVGTLTFKNANVAFEAIRSSSYTAGQYAGVDVAGDVVFSGGTATIIGSGSNTALKVGGDLTVEKNANVTFLSGGWASAIDVAGDIIVKNANLFLRHSWGTPSETKYLIGEMPAVMEGVSAVASTSASNYLLPNYQTALNASTTGDTLKTFAYIAFTHTHETPVDCTVASQCACGLNIEAKTAHVFDADCTTADKCANCEQLATAGTHAFDGDCTTDDTCANAGCEVKAAKANAHVYDNDCTTDDTCTNAGCQVKTTKANAHVFDNDCTTDDKCANCDQKAPKAAAHVFDNDCTTADKCANCDQVATAGQHSYDKDCTTADNCTVCGTPTTAANAHVFDNDCTTDDTCQTAGCEVKAEKKAAHAFDNDCTTADKCANCDQVATAGQHTFDGDCTTADDCSVCGSVKAEKKDAHVFDKDCTTDDKCANCDVKAEKKDAHVFDKDCTTADTCQTAGCEVKAEKKDAHVFDKDCTTDDKCANCDVKAEKKDAHVFDKDCTTADKCANCDVKAEAGAHIFDKDCTTADKCTSCGTVATAEKAHKYTNNADTTCDNAGCEHTRVVESGDKNPQTGDNTALVLCVCVLLTSAAALVITKKRFAL